MLETKLKIAFVHNRYPAYRRELFRLLSERNQVDFFVVNEPASQLPSNFSVLKGYHIPKMSDFEVVPGLFSTLWRAAAKCDYDLYVCTDLGYYITYITYLIARLKQKPFIVWNGQWRQVPHPRRWLTRPLERMIIRDASAYVTYSTKAKKYLVSMGADPESVFIAFNANDYSFTAPDSKKKSKFIASIGASGCKIVLFYGRLIPVKGVDVLLKAIRLVSDINKKVFLLIAGDGPSLPSLQRLAKKLSLPHCCFTAKEVRGESEKNLLLGIADVFVLPSRRTRISEAWGLVLNEAASAGIPSITTTEVGAEGDLILDGKNGVVVPPDNPQCLADSLLRILSDSDLADAMGKSAKCRAAQITPVQMAESFQRAFLKGVGNEKKANS